MYDNNKNKESKVKKRKAILWSLLWANVAMAVVLFMTFLFQRYLYSQMLKRMFVDVQINPFIVAAGYLVGMLILWGIIYKYETKEDDIFDDPNQNHNIY
ncbi:MAG: hypothetical protein IKB73_02375 [Ruminococcus sp.]|nr:hypothetical protein [Ruminococcus sp.]